MQNVGESIRNTDLFLTGSANRYVSGKCFKNYLWASLAHFSLVADVFALGAVIAIEAWFVCPLHARLFDCSFHCLDSEGPRIAYRGGRIDATGPNNPGVPEPQQTLEEHTAAIARQGFTPEEMTGLVACGHTFSGVQRQFFPDVVPPVDNDTEADVDATFDTTPFNFNSDVWVHLLHL
jgi:hypothetical protein